MRMIFEGCRGRGDDVIKPKAICDCCGPNTPLERFFIPSLGHEAFRRGDSYLDNYTDLCDSCLGPGPRGNLWKQVSKREWERWWEELIVQGVQEQ